MADVALNLLLSAGLSGAFGLNPASAVLSEPYEDWDLSFIPREDGSAPERQTSTSHAGGAFALEPGLRAGRWQVSASAAAIWLDWRTESFVLDWTFPANTDTVVYRFQAPTLGLQVGRWFGGLARPFVGAGAFRWQRVYSTYAGEVDALGQSSNPVISSEVLGEGWGGHAEVGVGLRRPTHEQRVAVVQEVRFAVRGTMVDDYRAVGGALTWAFGPDWRANPTPMLEPLEAEEADVPVEVPTESE
jgi:hypothetical protein